MNDDISTDLADGASEINKHNKRNINVMKLKVFKTELLKLSSTGLSLCLFKSLKFFEK